MSLFRQLWLAVIGMALLAFAGSFILSVLTARGYLEQQLYLKNVDNASTLALSISQMPEKDPVLLELMISAQFDTGHYEEISLVDPHRQIIVERRFTDAGNEAPHWFVALFPIKAQPGVAQVQDGWKQLGTLKVVSHGRFAYRELWHGTLDLLVWFAIAGVAAGALGTFILRLVSRPLNQVVDQAQALSERRFITVAEPRTPELRSVVRAMNQMVERLKHMFAEEAARLDTLRRQVNHDGVTGLPNRESFIGHLREHLSGEEAPPGGVLAFIRLSDLNEINRRLGHAATDGLLQNVARVLEDAGRAHDGGLAARVRGPDFALLIPRAQDATALAEQLSRTMAERIASQHPGLPDLFHVGAVAYRRGDAMGTLLAAADNTLAAAEGKGPNAWHALEHEEGAIRTLATSGETWRNLLSDALSEQRLRLAQFPVLASAGDMMHRESAVRLQAERDGPWLSAGDFMPMAVRLKLTAPLDLQVIRLALDNLATGQHDVAVNLSADTISDWRFRNQLAELLNQRPELCRRLWLEVPEYGAFQQIEAFRDLSRTLKNLGCHIGIEHFGHRFGEFAQLADLGLDYLKVDSSFIRDIHQNPGNREFLKGLCNMAHAIGISVIAEGVMSPDEMQAVRELGFDGTTGPAVTEMLPEGGG